MSTNGCVFSLHPPFRFSVYKSGTTRSICRPLTTLGIKREASCNRVDYDSRIRSNQHPRQRDRFQHDDDQCNTHGVTTTGWIFREPSSPEWRTLIKRSSAFFLSLLIVMAIYVTIISWNWNPLSLVYSYIIRNVIRWINRSVFDYIEISLRWTIREIIQFFRKNLLIFISSVLRFVAYRAAGESWLAMSLWIYVFR